MKTARLLFASPLFVALIALSVATAGCAFFPHQRGHRSGSVVAFLFPKERPSIQTPAMPVLNLPLRVGVAFVPSADGAGPSGFSDMQQQALLEKVAAQFRAQPFVQEIEAIPSLYLRPGGGFENLEQLRSVMGIDVIVLLSYDQVQFTEDTPLSLAYWTIVGAYTVQGNRNDTHTLMEATVYDIASRSLLFRAPGIDQTKAWSAPIDLKRELRQDSARSFEKATMQLTANLDASLERFRESVKAGRTNVQINHRPGFTGAGAIGPGTATLLFAAVLVGGSLYVRRHFKPAGARTRSALSRHQ